LLDVYYYSNRSGNTKRFAEKLGIKNVFSIGDKPLVDKDYILFVPTYGAGNEGFHVPIPVQKFLSIPDNSRHMLGVVGFGNTNFGETYCKAAKILSTKFGVPILGRVELFGTPEDVVEIQERLQTFYDKL